MARYALGVVGVLVALGVSNAVSLLLRVLVAHMGVREVGIFYLANYILKFLVFIALLGTGSYMVREVVDTPHNTKDILSYAYTLNIIASILCALGLYVLSPQVASYFREPLLTIPLRLVALAIPASVLYRNALFYLRSQMLVSAYALLQISYELVRLAAIACVVYFLPVIDAIFSVQSFVMVCCGMLSWWLVRGHLHKMTFKGPKTYIAYLFGATLAFSMLEWIDSFMLGRMASVYAVGLYDTAFVLASTLVFFPTAASTFLLPRLMRDDKDIARRVIEWTAFVDGLLCVMLVSFAPVLLSLFGSAFVESAPVLMVLAPGFYLGYVFLPLRTVLYSQKRQDVVFWIHLFVLVSAVGLNYLLIPLYGALGAAYATASALALLCVFHVVCSARHIALLTRRLAVSIAALVIAILLSGYPLAACAVFLVLHALSSSWRKEWSVFLEGYFDVS